MIKLMKTMKVVFALTFSCPVCLYKDEHGQWSGKTQPVAQERPIIGICLIMHLSGLSIAPRFPFKCQSNSSRNNLRKEASPQEIAEQSWNQGQTGNELIVSTAKSCLPASCE